MGEKMYVNILKNIYFAKGKCYNASVFIKRKVYAGALPCKKRYRNLIFGKHVNRYYLRHALGLLLGIVALVVVDYAQLVVPAVYKLLVNGISEGHVVENGTTIIFREIVSHIDIFQSDGSVQCCYCASKC